MKPFVSIIVACCDVEPFVRECLDSVLTQPFREWECLVGVETSKDDTEAIVREYAAKDSRFKVFTGPRSGSCSASRNTGIDMAQGEYVIFLDGDDSISENSLQRLHDKIITSPHGDMYPCALRVFRSLQRMNGNDSNMVFDAYPDMAMETSGTEAIIFHPRPIIGSHWMMQLFIFKRDFLKQHDLKCIHGINGQDYVFFHQAVYFAKHIIPLHEAYYNYRVRPDSVAHSLTPYNAPERFYHSLSIRFRALMMFYSTVSKADDFDHRVAAAWGRSWIGKICFEWFFPMRISKVPRQRRLETLKELFADGFETFEKLRKASFLSARVTGWWIRVFVTHPFWRGTAEMFFKAYFALHHFKNSFKKQKDVME